MVRWLLSAGAPVDKQCRQGKTAVHIAVEQRDLEILQVLGKGIDVEDNNGQTALHKAVGWPQGIQYLLGRGANPNVPDQGKFNPLSKTIIRTIVTYLFGGARWEHAVTSRRGS
jgi:ankyrin repeat protein